MGEQPVAVVSGASGGIGSAIAKRLAQAGWTVQALARDRARLEALCLVLRQCTPRDVERQRIAWHVCDVQSQTDIRELVAHIVRLYGYIDLLVTCHAAAPCIKPSEDVTAEDWRTIWETDVEGTFRVCQAVGRQMLVQRSGCIVNLSSIHALASYPMRSAYASAKSAVVGFSRVLAIEWADRGIRVNCIAPGQVEGPRTSLILAGDTSGPGGYLRDPIIQNQMVECMRQRVPNRQLVQPEDVAETVLWVAKTPSVNGQTIVLDHGLLASAWYEPFLERA